MKIKRVEILGFKSFVDKVSIDFQDGIAAILGPNGCGKSNIVDAIRWSMGEQSARNLRGRSMEDVIFGGSESRKPLGMAEVSMTFCTADGLAPAAVRDYPEITVTRRLYRNGDSEYLLNKTPCRLLDITELFMDTGVGARAYSIIEQGKIGTILNAKPEDRRFLIEEAAGITKYKSRKKTALRKIEATRQNLVRLGDVVAEVRRQMNSLKRQAQKAERYRAYREELKGIETRFALERYGELKSEAELNADREREAQQGLDGLSGRLEEGELTLETLRLEQVGLEKETSAGQEQVYHLSSEIQKVEGKIEIGAREAGNLDRQGERLTAEAEELSRRLADLDGEEEGLRESQASLGARLQSETRRLAEGETHLEEFGGLEEDLNARLEAARNGLYALLTELSRLSSHREEAQRRLQTLEERNARNRAEAVAVREKIEETEAKTATLENTLKAVRDRRDALRAEREGVLETLQVLRLRLEETESALQEHREELNRHRAHLDSLQRLKKELEGYGSGVKALLGEPGFRERFGMVADLLEVPPRYEVALEALLGERLQSLLATGPGEALEGLEYLRSRDGRCTFLLPGFVPRDVPAFAGGTPILSLVQLPPGRETPLQALLAGTFLAESLEPFCEGGLPPGVTLVTETGETLSCRGEVTGGGRSTLGQGILHKKREMKELDARVQELAKTVESLSAQRLVFREGMASAEERLREVEAALHGQDLQVVDSEKDLLRVREDTDRLQERLEVLSLEEDQLHEEREGLDRRLEGALQGHREGERRKSEQERDLSRLQEELRVLRGETAVVRERVTALKVEVASIREREEGSRRSLERLKQVRTELIGRAALLRSEKSDGEKERERLRRQAERLRIELDLLIGKREEERARFERLREGFEAASAKIEEHEEAIKSLRTDLTQAREMLASLQLKGRELQMEAEHLRQAILERYRVDLAEEEPGVVGVFEVEAAGNRLEELRKTLDEMGEVNLTAIEEFRKLEERYSFLTVQQEDLRRSMEGLQAAIAKINRTTRKRFRETFDQVNAKFREVFPRLFRGGGAELKLTDEEDLLETGIDIVAQPPGKKLQSVNLLSGGEKALTAVALIFSIFMIKPTPFCMLDEVDAPLDDANIGRFNELVRKMSETSQFIIITHNKRTMEIADTLYGVTMEEPGVSKLVSVRFNEL